VTSEPETVEISDLSQWTAWLIANGSGCHQVWVMIYKKSSGRQVVSFDALLEEALRWGWVDTQTRGIDDLRYRIRFRKRRVGSNWSPTNREIACRLIAAGRMLSPGSAVLPADLTCPM
jgi:uncharacterized protein YdeI (YjbR/CyaY-like superfamily)